jgi:hypothetical protein
MAWLPTHLLPHAFHFGLGPGLGDLAPFEPVQVDAVKTYGLARGQRAEEFAPVRARDTHVGHRAILRGHHLLDVQAEVRQGGQQQAEQVRQTLRPLAVGRNPAGVVTDKAGCDEPRNGLQVALVDDLAAISSITDHSVFVNVRLY